MDGPLNLAEIGRRASRPVENFFPVVRRLVREASERGTATVALTEAPRIRDGTVVQVDGTYYRTEVERTGDSMEVTGYEYEMETNESIRTAATPGETVALPELPQGDRTTILASPLGTSDPDTRIEEMSGGPVVFAYADETARAASVFVPEPEYEYVRYGETAIRFRLTGTRPVTVTTYRLGLAKVADSAAGYGEQVLSSKGHGVDPADLSPEAREFVETIIEEGHAERCNPLPDHAKEVIDTFGLTGKKHFVAYDEDWYEVGYHPFDR